MADAITQIGLIAGDIWRLIDSKGGETTLSELLNSIKRPKEFVLMGLGWLTREGQAFLEQKGRDFTITIKKQ